jgi:hypothetical protein
MAKVGAGGSFWPQGGRIEMRKGRPADGLFLLTAGKSRVRVPLDYSKREAVTRHASAAARCCSAFRRRLTVALGAALSFDVRYLIIPVGVASGTGNTVYGERTKGAIAERQKFSALLKLLRAG